MFITPARASEPYSVEFGPFVTTSLSMIMLRLSMLFISILVLYLVQLQEMGQEFGY
jgi:hypothetical protein